jgi:hypothetical protein
LTVKRRPWSVAANFPSVSAAATLAPAESVDPPAVREAASHGRWGWLWHLGVLLLCLGMGYWVMSGLWADPYRHGVSYIPGDQAFFEWLLGYGIQIIEHGVDPYFTDLMNAPIGVNLAANTSVTVFAVVFAPLTMLAGPQVSYVTILTLNLAGTAFGWYLLLARYAVRYRAAAAIGGLFCGFAPGWISHANGHLNWTAGWIAPLLLWWVFKLRDSRRWLLIGLLLGVLMAIGFSIAAELLFDAALAIAVFVIAWSCSRGTWATVRAAALRTLGALGVSAVVAGALLAYPLYMHFAGPQAFDGTGYDQRHYVEDAAAYFNYPFRSVAGYFGFQRGDLASNQTEGTSFFGAPLLLLSVVGAVLAWWRADRARKATVRALTIVGLIFAVLSLGPRLNWFNEEFREIPLLYAAVRYWPIFNAALPARMALVVVCVIGALLALLADRLLSVPHRPVWSRVVWITAFAAALVPIVPTPILTRERSAEPRFIADGTWKNYVSDGGVMSSLPYAASSAPDAQRWAAYTMARGGAQFRIPDGYFLGPGGPNGTGRVGALPRRTDWMFLRAATTGFVDDIDNFDRDRVREDLAYWNVQALFIPEQITGKDGMLFRNALVVTMTDLFGPPEQVQDVLLWRIRPGVDPVIRLEKKKKRQG